MFFIGLIGIALVAFFIWMLWTNRQMEKEEKERQKRKEERESWERKWNARKEAYDSAKATALSEMEAKWGKCSKNIFIDYSQTFALSDRVYAFEEAEKIVLGGNAYDFKDIIGFSLINKSETIYNAYTTARSRKNLGGMVARGVAGKIIAGDAGAVIGSLSADDEYKYKTEYDSEVENDYKIYVNVDSISSPTVTLNIGSNEDDAYETANLLNVIISRNRRKTTVPEHNG